MFAILARDDLQNIVCWLPHGRSWTILRPKEFEKEIIPAYFEHSKFTSFIRQANVSHNVVRALLYMIA